MNVSPDQRALWRSRAVIVGIFLLMFVPVVAAMALYYGGWRPATHVEHGDLINPPRPVADAVLRDVAGQPLPYRALLGKWTMLYLAPADCREICRRELYTLRQLYLAQGKDASRVQRVVVWPTRPDTATLAALEADSAGLIVLWGGSDELAAFGARFAVAGPDNRARIHIIDPHGNFMMSYTADTPPRGILKDLSRLLRLSKIG